MRLSVSTLTVTAKEQVTLRKDLLQHLGIHPGEKVAGYKIPQADMAEVIRGLINGKNAAVNRPAAEAGLALLDAGGDFADGVIAYEGSWLGADTFVSFDLNAVKLIKAQGGSALMLT